MMPSPPPSPNLSRTEAEAQAQVLILCTHNSARSILGEAMLNHWATRLGARVRAHSAGSAPRGRVHPLALETLQAAGVSTAGLSSKSWDAFAQKDAPSLSVVITVCDSAAAESCPVFTTATGAAPVRVHWGYPDPSREDGGQDAQRQAFDLVRQALGYRMLQLLQLPLATMDAAVLRAALLRIGQG